MASFNINKDSGDGSLIIVSELIHQSTGSQKINKNTMKKTLS